MSILALIPARGGSKRLPGKNIKRIGEMPLVHHAARRGVDAPSVDRVMLSTDSEEIQAAAWPVRIFMDWDGPRELTGPERDEPFGGPLCPFLRPPELATDTATSEAVIIHALDWLAENEGYEPDLVALLQPTSPLRTAVDVELCIQLAAKQARHAGEPAPRPVVTVDALTGARNGAVFVASPTWIRERYDAEPATEATHPAPADLWDPFVPYPMPHERSVDIDMQEDWDLAEFLMAQR